MHDWYLLAKTNVTTDIGSKARPATPIQLTETERAQLESWVNQPKAQARYVERARIIL